MHSKNETLYDRIGGEHTLNAAIDSYYSKVLGDDRINFFFDGVSMDRQIGKLKLFLKVAFGGGTVYTSGNLKKVHKPLLDRGLNDTHVDIILVHMAESLREIGVAEELIRESTETIDSYRDDVLGRR